MCVRQRLRLNPFFIRSIVQSPILFIKPKPGCLNPFFIRSIVQSCPNGTFAPCCVLIPSSSGQSFNAVPAYRAVPLCLNPFFIRSIVQFDFRRRRPDRRVLIPSSSGQSFNFRGLGLRSAATRLNPFFIRSIVQFKTPAESTISNRS